MVVNNSGFRIYGIFLGSRVPDSGLWEDVWDMSTFDAQIPAWPYAYVPNS